MYKQKVAWLMAAMLIVSLSGCDLPFGRLLQTGMSESSKDAESANSSSEADMQELSEKTAIATIPAQSEAPALSVILYLSNGNADGFITKTTLTDGTPEHIVSLLVEEKTLPEGCDLKSLTLDGEGGGIANMNEAYGAAISTAGTAGEYIRLGCLVNTLLTFFELDSITVTIEGRVPETGHEIYDYPLLFYKDQKADFNDPAGAGNENDLSGAIRELPRSDAVDIVWNRLSGYWTAADNLFVAFMWNEGLPCVTYGIWEAGGLGFGELINADPMGEYEAALSVRFPATEGNEIVESREESTVTVYIDVSGLDQDGKINIKIDGFGDGGYYTYAYGGATAEEAYQSIQG